MNFISFLAVPRGSCEDFELQFDGEIEGRFRVEYL